MAQLLLIAALAEVSISPKTRCAICFKKPVCYTNDDSIIDT